MISASKPWSRAVLALALITGALACSGPFVLLPGGALEGSVAPTPDNWAATDAIQTIQLETNPRDPYSVNLWVIADGEQLYVHAGASRATWVEHMESDPNVRLRVDDEIYELTATRVDSQEEFDRFSDLYEKKYDRRPRNENVDEAYLFRLIGR